MPWKYLSLAYQSLKDTVKGKAKWIVSNSPSVVTIPERNHVEGGNDFNRGRGKLLFRVLIRFSCVAHSVNLFGELRHSRNASSKKISWPKMAKISTSLKLQSLSG